MSQSTPLMPYENPGSGVNIAIWMCFVTAGMTVLSKILTKIPGTSGIFKKEHYHLDDLLCLIAILLSTIQTILVSQQVNAGLGQHYRDLEPASLRRYDVLGYTSQLFYLLAIAVAKGTGILFALRLRPSRAYRLSLTGLLYAVIGWTTISFLGITFQCQAPHTWKYIDGQCIDQFAFWTVVETINIVADLALTVLLIAIVWVLKVPMAKKLVLVFAFASRLLVIPAVAVRIHYLDAMYVSQVGALWDPTFSEAKVAIATSVVMNAAIIASCIPFLKPLVDSMHAGWSTSDVRKGLGFTQLYSKTSSSNASKLRSFNKGSVILDTSRSVDV